MRDFAERIELRRVQPVNETDSVRPPRTLEMVIRSVENNTGLDTGMVGAVGRLGLLNEIHA